MSNPIAEGQASRRTISRIIGGNPWIAKDDLEFGEWRPEIFGSGSMTISAYKVDMARYVYLPLVSLCFVSINITLTTAGVANTKIKISLPFPVLKAGQPFDVEITDTTVMSGHASTEQAEGKLIAVSKYDTSNFGLGAGRIVMASGIYITV